MSGTAGAAPPRWDAEADVVVVGAGTAGCVLANRLSEDPATQVLLVEAGGPDRHPLIHLPVGFTRVIARPDLNWGYVSEPEPQLDGRVLPVPRGRVLGGSSSINGMFHIRGHRLDFDDWARAGNAGWSYAEVLPYFRRSESHWLGASRWHGGEGPLQVRRIADGPLLAAPLREAAARAGHAVIDDYDGEAHEGFAPGQVAIDARGRRHSSARAYLRPARQRANLRVLTDALAARVLLREGRAIGVELRRGGTLQRVRARREVVLCGGAYGSPQLLMLSGIGPAPALQARGITPVIDLPGVGANLQEHARMPLSLALRQPVSFLQQLRLDRALRSALRWALFGSGPFASQISSGTLLLRTQPHLDRPDIQLLCNPVRLDARLWFPLLRPAQAHSLYVTVCLLYPASRGRVSLRSARIEDAPRIAFNLFDDPADRAAMRDAVRAARRLYATPPMADLVERELVPGAELQDDAALNQALRALGGITHHPVGTCAMGIGREAVVSPSLQVHGVAGLRVADAAVMPRMVGGNTNATTLMIAEKAADLLRGRSLPAAELM